MTEHEPRWVEPLEGRKVSTSGSDRILIALAVVALVGGAYVALGDLLPAIPEPEVAVVELSPAPEATRTPRPTASPRPLRAITLERGTPNEPPSELRDAWAWYGLVRARADLPILLRPTADAAETGMLLVGDLALIEGQSGDWLEVTEPLRGWIDVGQAPSEVIERLEPPYQGGPELHSINAGDGGYLVTWWDGAGRPMSAASTDGAHWALETSPGLGDHPDLGFGDWGPAAWGPAGWLSVVMRHDRASASPEVWRSTDGLAWSRLGRMVAPWGLYPQELAASEQGYLLTAGGDGGTSFWHSTDGTTWLEARPPGFAQESWIRVTATPIGFYVTDDVGWDRPPASTRAAFSADGHQWIEVQHGPAWRTLGVVSLAGALLTIELDDDGAYRTWIGTLDSDGVAWRPEPGSDDAFAGAGVTSLAGDGQRVMAFGWNRSDDTPLAWEREHGTWRRSPLPPEFEGIPRLAAGGPRGFVVVGSRPTLRASNPLFWHETGDGGWAPEPSPFVEFVPDPAREECGPPPRDAVEFLQLEPALAVVCFPGAPLTFRAWSVSCPDCFGWDEDDVYEPAWLAAIGERSLLMSPIRTNGWWMMEAALDPVIGGDPPPTNRWVEVTGHFDDPRAMTCRWIPSIESLVWYVGQDSVVDACRKRFVVTELAVVDGP